MKVASFHAIADTLAQANVRFILDVFIDHPFDFHAEWDTAKREPTGPNATEIRIASIPALIAMKQVAGRPRDLIDVEYLRKIQDDPQP